MKKMNKCVNLFLHSSTPPILDISLRGQLKMDTKNTPIPLNTTRLILMYKVGQGVRGQTIKSKNGSIQQSREHV